MVLGSVAHSAAAHVRTAQGRVPRGQSPISDALSRKINEFGGQKCVYGKGTGKEILLRKYCGKERSSDRMGTEREYKGRVNEEAARFHSAAGEKSIALQSGPCSHPKCGQCSSREPGGRHLNGTQARGPLVRSSRAYSPGPRILGQDIRFLVVSGWLNGREK